MHILTREKKALKTQQSRKQGLSLPNPFLLELEYFLFLILIDYNAHEPHTSVSSMIQNSRDKRRLFCGLPIVENSSNYSDNVLQSQ